MRIISKIERINKNMDGNLCLRSSFHHRRNTNEIKFIRVKSPFLISSIKTLISFSIQTTISKKFLDLFYIFDNLRGKEWKMQLSF